MTKTMQLLQAQFETLNDQDLMVTQGGWSRVDRQNFVNVLYGASVLAESIGYTGKHANYYSYYTYRR